MHLKLDYPLRFLLLITLLAALSSQPAFPNEQADFSPVKIEGSIQLDGIRDEPFWNEEARLPVDRPVEIRRLDEVARGGGAPRPANDELRCLTRHGCGCYNAVSLEVLTC